MAIEAGFLNHEIEDSPLSHQFTAIGSLGLALNIQGNFEISATVNDHTSPDFGGGVLGFGAPSQYFSWFIG